MTIVCAAAAAVILTGAALTLGQPEAAPASASQPTQEKLIALTFDDGPRRLTTTRLLDGLADRGASATFFLIGKQIPGQEDLILRMGQEGHQVGVHTYNHVLLTGLDPAEVEAELSPCRDLLEELLGPGEYLLRPPYGLTNQALLSQVRAPVVLWSIDPEDWDDRDTAREVEHILEHARDGSIILLHDIFPESVDAALQVVDALQAQGYRFVTVSQLFQARGITLEMGRVYGSAYPQT